MDRGVASASRVSLLLIVARVAALWPVAEPQPSCLGNGESPTLALVAGGEGGDGREAALDVCYTVGRVHGPYYGCFLGGIFAKGMTTVSP